MTLLPYALFALCVAGLASLLTWIMARWRVLVDVPNARSSHARPTPRGGGVAILAVFIVGFVVLGTSFDDSLARGPAFTGFIGGALIVGLAGLADDIRSLSFVIKLAAQLAAAVVAMAAGIVIETVSVPGIGPVMLGPLGYALTGLWLVGLTNAFNFMDGLDGLAGGTAALAAAFLCAAALILGEPALAMTALLLSAACAGFLTLNFPPARIFMGDVGSQFLGFAFAALGIVLARGDSTGTLILYVPLLLFNFLFDTLFTALRRVLRGENPTAAHRTHLYQLLNRSGFSHRYVALTQYLMVVVQGLAALWMIELQPGARWLVFAPFAALHAVYAAVILWLFHRKNKTISP